jgi:hypothetical protein
MFDPVPYTNAVKQILESPFILPAIGKLDAVSGEDCMSAIGHNELRSSNCATTASLLIFSSSGTSCYCFGIITAEGLWLVLS